MLVQMAGMSLDDGLVLQLHAGSWRDHNPSLSARFGPDMGADAVLINSAIAHAAKPVLMAEAMQHAVLAGRQSFLSGRMPRKLYATASSPLEGLSK